MKEQELLQMISNLLDEKLKPIQEGMHRLEERMAGLEQQMNRLEERIGGLERRMDRLEQKVENLEQRVGSLETKTKDLIKRMDAMEKSYVILAGKIDKVEQRMMDIEFIIETRLAQEIHVIAEGYSFVNNKLIYLIETMQKYRDIPITVHFLYYEFQQMKRQQTMAQ